MKWSCFVLSLLMLLVLGTSTFAQPVDPWADNIVEYILLQETDVVNDFVTMAPFSDSSTALGEPTRFTSDPENFGGAVQPFNSPFRANEVVSIGEGGSLTVSFNEPVTDDPLNPFGIDLLVFGNSFYFLTPFASEGVAGSASTEGGLIEVSEDGTDFVEVVGVGADGVFPTLGYSDLTDPLSPSAGQTLSDFTKPVDPNFNPTGQTFSVIVAGYNGSGGGVGIDLTATGLGAISYVRISNPLGSGVTPEIDAFADVRAVPEPSSCVLGLAGVIAGMIAGRRKRRKN